MSFEFFFQIAILIMSVVIHEVAHGVAARFYGDHTAEYEGRLTLNPLRHLDPIGSFLVPLVAYFTGGFIFGWAKPVPYNPFNLKPGRWPEAAVALAGPTSNFILASVFAVVVRLGDSLDFSPAFLHITSLIVFVNLLLMVFNLMPIPPLDGSKLLFAVFPDSVYRLRHIFERYGLILVIFFILFAWKFIEPLVAILFGLLTGL